MFKTTFLHNVTITSKPKTDFSLTSANISLRAREFYSCNFEVSLDVRTA